jgi:hypothetical protein
VPEDIYLFQQVENKLWAKVGISPLSPHIVTADTLHIAVGVAHHSRLDVSWKKTQVQLY